MKVTLAAIAAVVAALVVLVLDQGAELDRLQERMDEVNCVHVIEEDGSAVHPDAEVAFECLRLRLGWTNYPESSPDATLGP